MDAQEVNLLNNEIKSWNFWVIRILIEKLIVVDILSTRLYHIMKQEWSAASNDPELHFFSIKQFFW